jgi:group I intron endonuclease
VAQSGIYQIVNTVNNKRYIGSAVNLRKRENEHFAQLRRGIHHSPYLQRSYVKHGGDAFVFETLITCHPTMCIWYEQQFLDAWKPEYNLSVRADSRLGAPQPESMAKAQSERMKKRWAGMTPEKRREMSKKVSQKVKNYWMSQTPEDRVAAAKKASDASKKTFENMSDEDKQALIKRRIVHRGKNR